MWPFKKKAKEIPVKKISVSSLLVKTRPPCPVPSCVCFDCPCRGTCAAEEEVRMAGLCTSQVGYKIMSCSWKKHLRGELTNAKEETTRGTAVVAGGLTRGSINPETTCPFGESPTVRG